MNCQEFVLLARDLARHQTTGELLDARWRAQGLAHAQACPACAARLADERQLAAGLRAWALADASLSAGAHLESALLTAFRQQPRPAPVQTERAFRQRWFWAVAAVLLLSLLTWALRAWLPGASSDVRSAPSLAHGAPTSVGVPAPAPLTPVTSVAQAAPPRVVHVAARPKRPKPRYRIEQYLVESEIATDFLPLTDQATWPRREQLRTVRVEMPRTVLVSFGLPMSLERATEPIQAELLINADGLARAIRFIQTNLEAPQIISANNPSSQE
jgi:hypothetical protein